MKTAWQRRFCFKIHYCQVDKSIHLYTLKDKLSPALKVLMLAFPGHSDIKPLLPSFTRLPLGLQFILSSCSTRMDFQAYGKFSVAMFLQRHGVGFHWLFLLLGWLAQFCLLCCCFTFLIHCLGTSQGLSMTIQPVYCMIKIRGILTYLEYTTVFFFIIIYGGLRGGDRGTLK